MRLAALLEAAGLARLEQSTYVVLAVEYLRSSPNDHDP
jgi:hypothetical protein